MSDLSNPRRLVVFTLGGERYALAIERMQEIIRWSSATVAASAEVGGVGVLNLRGEIVPVYDLARQWGIDSPVAEDTKIIVLASASQTAGVIVESVESVLTIDDRELVSAPGSDSVLLDAITEIGERRIVLVACAAIFADHPSHPRREIGA